MVEVWLDARWGPFCCVSLLSRDDQLRPITINLQGRMRWGQYPIITGWQTCPSFYYYGSSGPQPLMRTVLSPGPVTRLRYERTHFILDTFPLARPTILQKRL